VPKGQDTTYAFRAQGDCFAQDFEQVVLSRDFGRGYCARPRTWLRVETGCFRITALSAA